GTLKNIAYNNMQHYIDQQKAITCYTTLIDKETTKGPNLWNRGVIYFDLQDYEKALNDFTLIIQENINEEYLRNAWWLSGLIHLKRDSYTNAINCFRAAQTLQNLDNNHISFPFFIGQLD